MSCFNEYIFIPITIAKVASDTCWFGVVKDDAFAAVVGQGDGLGRTAAVRRRQERVVERDGQITRRSLLFIELDARVEIRLERGRKDAANGRFSNHVLQAQIGTVAQKLQHRLFHTCTKDPIRRNSP